MFVAARSYAVVDGHRRDRTSLCIRHINKTHSLTTPEHFRTLSATPWLLFGVLKAYLPCYQKEENWKLFSPPEDHTNSLLQWACHELVFCHEMIINPSYIACVVVYNFISTTNSIEKSSKNPWFCGWFSTKYCLPEKQSNSPRSMY